MKQMLKKPSIISKILKTHDLEAVRKECDLESGKVGEEVWAIFDCDDVLIRAEDLSLWSMYDSKEWIDMENRLGSYRALELWDIVWKNEKHVAVDEKTPDLIRDLQRNKVRALVLTQMFTGKLNSGESMEAWRKRDLENIGYDFSLSWPDMPDYTLTDVQVKPGQTQIATEYKNMYYEQRRHPVFKAGVLSASYGNKGDVLESFMNEFKKLNPSKPLPKKIVFVDDRFSKIAHIQRIAFKYEIEFVGIYYTAVEDMAAQVPVSDKIPEIVAKLERELA